MCKFTHIFPKNRKAPHQLIPIQNIIYTDCPTFIEGGRWGIRAPVDASKRQPLRNPDFIAIHHTGGLHCRDHSGCTAAMRGIQATHLSRNRYNEIGFNFAIGGNGLVYVGRGWSIQGEFASHLQSRSLSVAFIGNYGNVLPNQRQLNTFQSLIICGMQYGVIPQHVTYFGHHQVRHEVACPGQAFLHYLSTWPRFNRNPV